MCIYICIQFFIIYTSIISELLPVVDYDSDGLYKVPGGV